MRHSCNDDAVEKNEDKAANGRFPTAFRTAFRVDTGRFWNIMVTDAVVLLGVIQNEIGNSAPNLLRAYLQGRGTIDAFNASGQHGESFTPQ
jgi:hypothetical protein